MGYCRKPLERREVEIIQRMKKALQYPVTKIAEAVGRNKSTVYRACSIKLSQQMRERGRGKLLSPAEINHLVRVLRAMIKKAEAKYEVSLAMLKKQSKVQGCEKTLRKALATKGIKFRRLRSKPILTRQDRKDRMAFAEKYRKKPATFWVRHVHLHHDCKAFPAYVTAKARDYAAMREVRGAYRETGQGLDEAYVVVPKDMRFNPGCKAVRIAGGVGNGKLMLWHDYGSRWSGSKAAQLYKGPVVKGLTGEWPRKRSFQVLEDNDPTGYKSKLAIAAKQKCRLRVLALPKRSPDLNVMDYAIWKAINRKMRAQERRMKRSTRESRNDYIKRLARAAKSLSSAFIQKACMNMKRRCELLYKAKGGHFEEGS